MLPALLPMQRCIWASGCSQQLVTLPASLPLTWLPLAGAVACCRHMQARLAARSQLSAPCPDPSVLQGDVLADWGVGAMAANPDEAIPEGRETRRLAVLDLDWSHVRAVDILAVLRSFLSAGQVSRRPGVLSQPAAASLCSLRWLRGVDCAWRGCMPNTCVLLERRLASCQLAGHD